MQLSFYSFFVKYSVLDKYGFLSGLWARLGRKLIPEVASEGSFEFFLQEQLGQDEGHRRVEERISYLLSFPRQADIISADLNSSIVALISRVVSTGLDHNILSLLDQLGIERDCISDLSVQLGTFTQDPSQYQGLETYLSEVDEVMQELRDKKGKVGTSLHLTAITQEIKDIISRCQALLLLRSDLNDTDSWKALIGQYLIHHTSKNSLRRYFNAHTDLLALEIVEHTSQKGESYVAESKAEYKKFFVKGLKGGAIIACFALFKVILDKNFNSEIPSALAFSINYATCFILVKILGGTIATKQPAMTASTITKYIDKDNDLEIDDVDSVVSLVRMVSRSQFVSLIGNFTMALLMAIAIGLGLKYGLGDFPVDNSKAGKLMKSVLPFAGGGVIYAAIAGIFLALSGFISGYFDNKVLASKIPYRLLHHRRLGKLTSTKFRTAMGSWIQANLGTIAGNVALGFMLGMAWLLTYVLPFPVDIRHIAFSSSNVGYAMVTGLYGIQQVAVAMAAVLLIGTVNFVVSFSLTLILAFKSRHLPLGGILSVVVASAKDFIRDPLSYFLYREVDTPTDTIDIAQ